MGEEEEPAARLDTSKCYADKGTQTEPVVTLFSTGPGWYENLLRLSREDVISQGFMELERTGWSRGGILYENAFQKCSLSGFLLGYGF